MAMTVIGVWTGRHATTLKKAMRLTNEELADTLGIAIRTIAKWNAEPDLEPVVEMQRALDTLLRTAPDEAKHRFAVLVEQTDQASPAAQPEPSTQYPDLHETAGTTKSDFSESEWTDENGENVLRREFVTASMAAVGLAITPPLVTHLAVGRRIGRDAIDYLRCRTTRLRHLDDYLGGADTYNLYSAELSATINLANQATYTEPIGRALRALIAEQAQQAGWAAFDAGQNANALRLFNTALQAARESGDAALTSNTLAFMAYQNVSVGRSGIQEAIGSCDALDNDAPSAVRALIYERAAWSYALCGKVRETEQALAQANRALDQETSQRSPDWATWVDRNEVAIMTGRCWTHLRRPLRAVPALEIGLAHYDDSHARDKALYSTWLAEAYLDGGEIEQATTVLHRALDLSADVASIRPKQRISEVLNRFTPHRELPAVAQLFDRTAS